MTLEQRLVEDLKKSLKGGAKERTAVLRFLLAQLQNRAKEKYAARHETTLTDEEVTEVLQKETKKRKEAIALFQQGHREDLVGKEEKELAVIAEYLPTPMEPAEVQKVIDALVAQGIRDPNLLMKEAMQRVKGRADGRMVREMIKTRLQ